MTVRHSAALLLTALGLALASIVVPGTRLEVQDWDCPPAPASCARPVVVGGFPARFASDYHGISPVGSVDLVSLLLGDDHFHADAFGANVLFYLLVVTAVARVRDRARRRGWRDRRVPQEER